MDCLCKTDSEHKYKMEKVEEITQQLELNMYKENNPEKKFFRQYYAKKYTGVTNK